MKVFILLISIGSSIFATDYNLADTKANLHPKTYGNKFFITNRLFKIFGKESLPILEENIITSHPDLAGPCDIYEQVYVKREETESIYKECIRGKIGTLSPLTGKNTVIRTSLITKTCMDLLNSPKVLGHLEEKHRKSENLIQAIHNDFYPLDVKKELLSKGYSIEEDHFFKKDILKRTYLLFCLSEDWQLI